MDSSSATTTVRVGEWSTTVDPTSPYYNTIFSAMDEVPTELRFDEWKWMPEQWSKWEVVRERMESFQDGDECVYYDRVIHYNEIEMLHRCFLDLPDAWASFVVFDIEPVGDEVVRKRLAASGSVKWHWPTSIDGAYPDSNNRDEEWCKRGAFGSIVDLWHKCANRLVPYSIEDETDILDVMGGLWRNATMKSKQVDFRYLSLDWLMYLYNETLDQLVNGSPHYYTLERNSEEHYTLDLFTKVRSKHGYQCMYALTMMKSIPLTMGSLHPTLYLNTFGSTPSSCLLWTRRRVLQGTPIQIVTSWAGQVHVYITRLVYYLLHSDMNEVALARSIMTDEDNEKCVRGLLSVVGRKNGSTVYNKVSGFVRNILDDHQFFYSTVALIKRLLSDETLVIPDEMMDFSNEIELVDHLKKVIG